MQPGRDKPPHHNKGSRTHMGPEITVILSGPFSFPNLV